MSILVDKSTRVMIQGITGKVGRSVANKMIEDGTNIVCGVTPGKGGETICGLPVFNSIYQAVEECRPDICFSAVPAPFLKEALLECIYGGLKKIVVYTEGIPLHDEYYCVYYAKLNNVMLFGPNSAGVVSPGKANVSDLNSKNLKSGNVGIVSKSGTITYEIIDYLKKYGYGESTIVCLGGDRVVGTSYNDVLPLFESDQQTDLVLLVGEIGGESEIEAAQYVKKMTKPVMAYIAGQKVPPGKRMGHAGAIVGNVDNESAKNKLSVLKNAGAYTFEILQEIPDIINKLLRPEQK